MSVFVKGLIVGFALAAPVGPIAALCVQRTIARRWMAGFVSGLGAAVADALYGLVAAFGATFVSEFLINEHEWLQRVGGVILILLGVRLIVKRVEPREAIIGANGIGNGEAGQEVEGPMAIVILGGLASSTLLNLLVLPAVAARYYATLRSDRASRRDP